MLKYSQVAPSSDNGRRDRVDDKYIRKGKKKIHKPHLRFGSLTGNPVEITLTEFNKKPRRFNGLVWMLDVHNRDLILGQYLEKTYLPWPRKMKEIKLSQMASICTVSMKEFENGKDVGKNYQLQWLGIAFLLYECFSTDCYR